MLASNAYRALSPNARALLVELVMLYNGENNGSLFLSVRDAAHRIGLADATAASRAFDELMELGFIEVTQIGHFRVKASEHSRARCWRLCWLCGPGRKLPEWHFLEREPAAGTQARRRMERGLRVVKTYRRAKETGRLPVLDSDTLDPLEGDSPPLPVLDSDTLNSGNGRNPPNSIVRDSATHIATTMGSGSADRLIGWWQPDWTPQISMATFAQTLCVELNRASATWREAA